MLLQNISEKTTSPKKDIHSHMPLRDTWTRILTGKEVGHNAKTFRSLSVSIFLN